MELGGPKKSLKPVGHHSREGITISKGARQAVVLYDISILFLQALKVFLNTSIAGQVF